VTFAAVDHVTQREPGPWRDCTFASTLETLRLALANGRDIPSEQHEVERFRAATGLPDNHTGSTIPQIMPVAERLYGVTPDQYVITGDWAAIHRHFADEANEGVITGMMAAVPPHLRRWSPGFHGAHAVAARGSALAPTWCDPLAPKGAYHGEPVSWSVWESFFGHLPGARALLMREYEEGAIPLPIYQLAIRPGTLTVPANEEVRGWKPTADGWAVARLWLAKPSPSTARFDATLTRIGGSTVPKSLLRVVSGFFADLYVSSADVQKSYDP